jgi:hypothetical protein
VDTGREYRQALTVAAAAVGKQTPEYALVESKDAAGPQKN